MAIDRHDVKHVATLARLELGEEEVVRATRELAAILDYVRLLDDLDLQDVPPSHHEPGATQALRADEPRPSLAREEALANAPEHDGVFVVVPKIV